MQSYWTSLEIMLYAGVRLIFAASKSLIISCASWQHAAAERREAGFATCGMGVISRQLANRHAGLNISPIVKCSL